ncbi:hypothetical protein MMC29_000623 [Sticta canariensis]|nr:hypothetical protein [Sticta canariensis]
MLWAMIAISNTIAAPASLLNHRVGNADLHTPPSPHHSLNPANVRRQNSWAGNMLVGGIRGAFTAGVNMAGDKIAQELTGNDKDHPQKSKDELEEERRKKEEEEQEAERKKKVEEDEEE